MCENNKENVLLLRTQLYAYLKCFCPPVAVADHPNITHKPRCDTHWN